MQSTAENKFTLWISKRNSPEYPILKSRSNFSLLLFIGLALGVILFFAGTKSGMTADNIQIESHVNSLVSDNSGIADLIVKALSISRNDLCHIFFIFLSGFTYFCTVASGLIIFSKGVILGFSLTYAFSLPSCTDNISSVSFGIVFSLFKIAICLTAVFFAADAHVFSYDFRIIKQKFSVLRRASVTYSFIFYFARALGASILLNLIYCTVIKLLQT